MKYFIVLILILIPLCDVVDQECRKGGMESYELYYGSYTGILPENCIDEIIYPNPWTLKLFKCGGCDFDIILEALRFFKPLQSLDISYSSYKMLKFIEFKHRNLVKLNASHNALLKIPAFYFYGTPNMIEIDFSYNNISAIGLYDFEGAVKLTKIHLKNNIISNIQKYAFVKLTQLEFIDLSSNSINRIKCTFVINKMLKFMNFDNNFITRIDDILPKNGNLHELRLTNNPLERLGCFINSVVINGGSVYVSWAKYTRTFRKECISSPIRVVSNSGYEGVFPMSQGRFTPKDLHIEEIHNQRTDLLMEEIPDHKTNLHTGEIPLKPKSELHCHDQSFKRIQILSLNPNQCENVVELLHCMTSSLENLKLTGNFVGKLKADALQRFHHLSILILSDTHLIEFDFSLVKSLKKLEHLDISRNNLKQIGNISILKSLDNLNELKIDGNQLHIAPDFIQNLKWILKLSLSGNYVEKLNATILEKLKSLRKFNLSNTNLKLNDFRPFELLNLTVLDISNNNLEHVNITASHMFTNLEEFYAVDCKINAVTELIPLLGASLRKLDLSENQVGKLNSTTFEKFTNLQSLTLRKTRLLLDDFHPFESVTTLKKLDISHNNLESINFNILSKFLQYCGLEFRIANCNIKNSSALIRLLPPYINTLDLSGNFLGEINAETFGNLKRLDHFYLGNTNLSNFDSDILKQRRYLKMLNISFNHLKKIDFTGQTNENLEALYMEGNELIEIKNLSRLQFKELNILAISMNQLSCAFLEIFLTQMQLEWPRLIFSGDPWNQKHGENCTGKYRPKNEFTEMHFEIEDGEETKMSEWDDLIMVGNEVEDQMKSDTFIKTDIESVTGKRLDVSGNYTSSTESEHSSDAVVIEEFENQIAKSHPETAVTTAKSAPATTIQLTTKDLNYNTNKMSGSTEVSITQTSHTSEESLPWLYIVIGISILNVMIIVGACFVFRKRLMNKSTRHDAPTMLYKRPDTLELTIPNHSLTYSAPSETYSSPDEHIYETIAEPNDTYDHLQLEIGPIPISINNHYHNPLLLNRKSKNYS